MSNKEQVDIIKKGVYTWNAWIKIMTDVKIDLSSEDFSSFDLKGIYLKGANLQGTIFDNADLSKAVLEDANLEFTKLNRANLNEAYLKNCNLQNAELEGAVLIGADLQKTKLNNANLKKTNLKKANLNLTIFSWANLSNANLENSSIIEALFFKTNLNGANLSNIISYDANFQGVNLKNSNLRNADLYGARFSTSCLQGADLRGSILTRVRFIECNFEDAKLCDSKVYGVSTWGIKTNSGTEQTNLIITKKDEPIVTVDNLEVAQFIYLLINNKKIREVLDTIASKVVLILGSFTKERKVVLDCIRNELRKYNYIPIMFDSDKPTYRNTNETISTLAHMARFVIADLTEPKSIPQELITIVQNLPSLLVQPVLMEGQEIWGMYDGIKAYPWVLEIVKYKDRDDLIKHIHENIIQPIEKRMNLKK